MEQIPSKECLIEKAKEIFKKEFGSDPKIIVTAPGKINLMGEHTDYNNGFLLPIALPLTTVIVGNKTEGKESVILTTDETIEGPRKVVIDQVKRVILTEPKPKWADYILGTVASYIGPPQPFEAVIVSSVPAGRGLSSSTALTAAMYTFLDALNGSSDDVRLVDKALLCNRAEEEYARSPCRRMDPFVTVMGKKDAALLIDCWNVTSSTIPFVSEEVVVLIISTNVKHELTGKEFSARKEQCYEAAKLLKKDSLGDAHMGDFDKINEVVEVDETIVKRGKHVVSEIDRTRKAAQALEQNDFVGFGKLMTESHRSLKNNYEISSPQTDELVELTLEVEGVLGSKVTGRGIGGCVVTLVRRDAVDKVIKNIKAKYKGDATFYVCSPSDGAQILSSPYLQQ